VGVAYLDSWRNKAKEEQEITRRHWDQQLHHIYLHVSSRMYVSLTSFDMHGICMWILGHDLSFAWSISWIDSGFPSLSISLISMEFVGLFPF